MYVKTRSIQPRFNQLTVNWVNKIMMFMFSFPAIRLCWLCHGLTGPRSQLCMWYGVHWEILWQSKVKCNILFDMIWHLFFWYMNNYYSFGIFWSKLKGLLWVTGQVPSFLYICWVKVFIIYLFIFYLFGRKKHIYIQTSVYYKNVRLKD